MPHCQVTIVACPNCDRLVGDVWIVGIRHLVSLCISLLRKYPTPYIISQQRVDYQMVNECRVNVGLRGTLHSVII